MLDRNIPLGPFEVEEDGEFVGVIESAVREHLAGGEILSVRSHRGEDFDGDEVIVVTVVVNAAPEAFDPDRLASLASFVRSQLMGIDEFAFPMLSFMSQKEYAARAH